MKKMKAAGLFMLCLLMVLPAVVWAEGTEQEGKILIDRTADAPQCEAKKEAEVIVPFINQESADIMNVRVTLLQEENTSDYPFEITKTNVFETLDLVKQGNPDKVVFKLKTREDVSSGYKKINFVFSYQMTVLEDGAEVVRDMEASRYIYVRTIAKEEPVEEPPEEEPPVMDPEGDDGGGVYDGGGYTDGGGTPSTSEDEKDEKKGSTPRVIIEGFQTDPGAVNAGDTFRLTLKVRNTSKKTTVGNMVITLQTPQAGEGETAADAFLPADGSSTLYIESIPKNSSKEVSLEMTARTDLIQKPYPVEAAMKYEDESAQQFEEKASISIPVRQRARFELSRVTVMPEAISVGEETNVTFEIYNLGKTKLYNVSARIEDPSIANAEAFVGNLDAGATGTVDMMAMGAAESTGDGTVKLLVKYEDQDGNQETFESSCIVFVNPAMSMDEMPMDDLGMEGMEEGQSSGHLMWWILGGAGAVAVIIVSVLLVRRKHKKEKEWADEILGSDKDELQ
ncbi:hypothetical protein MCG98_17295 [Ruminococcus sp. OA3]|uniref:COG1361 S-layer family protein n=1 Tax=Ruminococcus sp. OA3 TaxID=2914164 RepID=UPI001F056259|nr:hypothetical protein [Ruminococcus sp. OA3]MCH1984326.1 hypothetical protein [Ruminococcus sp. OA3]